MMDDHIDSLHLLELAEMPAIIDEPEWPHIRDCLDCGKAFIVLIAMLESSTPDEGLLSSNMPVIPYR